MFDFLTRKTEPESVPAEPWQTVRLREVNRELARADADLEAIDGRIRQFFSRPDDPRATLALAQDGSRGGAILIEDYPSLRTFEMNRDSIRAKRAKLLDERASLLK